jgi:hypothetical protein
MIEGDNDPHRFRALAGTQDCEHPPPSAGTPFIIGRERDGRMQITPPTTASGKFFTPKRSVISISTEHLDNG